MSILGAAAPPGAIVVNSATPLWYLTRATGLVALVLLTASMALGLLSSVRYQRPAWPRFVIVGLHRNLSLLALVFTGVHIATTLADTYAPIRLQDVVIPFISAYRPLWLGLGTIAFDLMIALTVTSLLRTRISYRSWHLVHWGSYLCWPVAVLHGLGTGSDTQVTWVLGLTIGCVAMIAGLTGWRLAYGWPSHAFVRLAGALIIVLTLVAGGAWLAAGPLRPGWARRSGTPPSLITGGTRAGATAFNRGRILATAAALDRGGIRATAASLEQGGILATAAALDRGGIRATAATLDRGRILATAAALDRGRILATAATLDRGRILATAAALDRGRIRTAGAALPRQPR